MTTTGLDLLAAFDHVFGPQDRSRPRPVDPASFEDEDTLRRSFGGLSKRARREQRRLVTLRVDEYGYDQRGRYHAERDGVA